MNNKDSIIYISNLLINLWEDIRHNINSTPEQTMTKSESLMIATSIISINLEIDKMDYLIPKLDMIAINNVNDIIRENVISSGDSLNNYRGITAEAYYKDKLEYTNLIARIISDIEYENNLTIKLICNFDNLNNYGVYEFNKYVVDKYMQIKNEIKSKFN